MNTASPKISVLMPIYNTKEEHLRQAIESILTQSEQNFEFLILNDSPENTGLDIIVQSYTDARILYLKNEHNLGITPSRNKLIELARAEYLAVMDHDDISLPERFQKEAYFLDKNMSVGVVSCLYKLVGEEEIISRPVETEEIKKELIYGHCAILHPASMIRKSVLNKLNLRYEENFSPAEDYALWCRLINKTNFYNIPECLFLYRSHEQNTTLVQRDKMAVSTRKIKLFVKEDYPLLWQKYGHRIEYISFLGLPLFKIKYKLNHVKYYLFGCIPVFIKSRR